VWVGRVRLEEGGSFSHQNRRLVFILLPLSLL
jgi:hypothetical protein